MKIAYKVAILDADIFGSGKRYLLLPIDLMEKKMFITKKKHKQIIGEQERRIVIVCSELNNAKAALANKESEVKALQVEIANLRRNSIAQDPKTGKFRKKISI